MPTPEMRDYPQDIWEAAQALRTAAVWQSNAANEIIAAALYAQRAPLLDERDALRAALADLINAAASMRRHALAIVGADTQDQDAAEAFEMYHDATETLRKTEARSRAALSQSTPQTEVAI